VVCVLTDLLYTNLLKYAKTFLGRMKREHIILCKFNYESSGESVQKFPYGMAGGIFLDGYYHGLEKIAEAG
jgi:hypothetical protein